MLSATISERTGRWFISLNVEQDIPTVQARGPAAGVDLGLVRIATVSDGTMFPSPRTLPRLQRKLRRAQKSLSRRKRGSRNRTRAAREIARTYARIADARTDLLHKVTTHLTRTKSVIGVEDLNAAGMLKNRCIAKAVSEAAFYRFRSLLEYKARWYGVSVSLRADHSLRQRSAVSAGIGGTRCRCRSAPFAVRLVAPSSTATSMPR